MFNVFKKMRVRVRSRSVFSRKMRVRVLFAFMFVFGIMELAASDQGKQSGIRLPAGHSARFSHM